MSDSDAADSLSLPPITPLQEAQALSAYLMELRLPKSLFFAYG